MPDKLVVILSGAEALEAAKALECRAANEAGQSQAPDLFTAEDTVWWELARALRLRIKDAKDSRRSVR